MKIAIYQIDWRKDNHRVKFMSYDRLPKFQGSSEVDSSIYSKVYEGDVSSSDLEGIFQMFNIWHPEDFTGHSLSVSDVVEVLESDDIATGFYFCDSIGFKRISFDKTATASKEQTA